MAVASRACTSLKAGPVPRSQVSRDHRANWPACSLRGLTRAGQVLAGQKNAPWLSVPQFGDWDQKGALPDYSLDFSKIREMRKQNKRDVSRASLGNEEELMSSNAGAANTGHSAHSDDHHYNQNQSPTVRF
nr:uncharacterized protein LOC109147236 [Ipomoea batatas]